MKITISYKLITVAVICVLFACKNAGDFKTHESGLQYFFFNHNDKASKPKQGDILVLKMVYKTESGEIVFDSREMKGSFRMQLTKPSHPGGSVEDGLSLLNLGDSIRFMVDAQSFFEITKKQTCPPNIKPGSKLVFDVKLLGIQSYNDIEQERMASYHANYDDEMKLLADYLKKANITVKPTASGLYYIETKKGKGARAVPGKTITVHYTGSFIDGRVFDSSLERNEPFSFELGKGSVIKGWDEGIAMMCEGGKATLIIPSPLAYKDKQTGPVAPFSTLIFEIEILKVK
ncbi:MAG: FKBP-type peptidyl-prolyl cis-trans isomerase [Bacteroidia bacterium]|nr:FKBP-type peptidyl-prolyl cis-trans isomerase [Bacteroidia bacterium]